MQHVVHLVLHMLQTFSGSILYQNNHTQNHFTGQQVHVNNHDKRDQRLSPFELLVLSKMQNWRTEATFEL